MFCISDKAEEGTSPFPAILEGRGEALTDVPVAWLDWNQELWSPNQFTCMPYTNKDMCHESLLLHIPKWLPGPWWGGKCPGRDWLLSASGCVERRLRKLQAKGRELKQVTRRQGGQGPQLIPAGSGQKVTSRILENRPEEVKQTGENQIVLLWKCLEMRPPGLGIRAPPYAPTLHPAGNPIQTVGNPSGTLCSNQNA